MHCPKAFEENRPDVLLALIQQYPLATIISHSPQGLEVNVVPVLVKQEEGKIVLRGHMAKNNAQKPRHSAWQIISKVFKVR